MSDLVVQVKLWGKMVGYLMWDSTNDVASFEYDPAFRKNGWPVSPLVMPVPERGSRVFQFLDLRASRCFAGLPGLIADSLPDDYGTQVINEYFRSRGVPTKDVTVLDRLCYAGSRAMGALEFEPSNTPAELNESTLLQVSALTDLAKEICNRRSEFSTNLKEGPEALNDIFRVGTSAGGAKPKAIVAYNETTQEVRSGQVRAPEGFSYWLLKFDGVNFSEHDSIVKNPVGIGNVEFAYYKMALESGIQMNECKLLEDGTRHHFMTRRFDRDCNGEKLHMQTLAAINHLDRDMRHSYEELFEVARRLELGDGAAREIFRRAVFNVLAVNNDDHTKNFSFLMNREGRWNLAPAYDLCYANDPESRWINKHQMAVNLKQKNITLDDLRKMAGTLGIRGFEEDIQRVRSAVDRWPEIAKDCGVRQNHLDEIQKAIDNQRALS